MLLDSVVDATIQNGTSGRNTVTAQALTQFGRALPFRGLLHNVQGTTNGELLAKSQLAYKVHQMPVGVIGTTETRPAKGYQALVRGDTGGLLSITSDSFVPHQNSEILADMQQMAEIGKADICFAGSLDEGRKVVAVARMEGEFVLPNKTQQAYRNNHVGSDFDDKTYLFVVISGGHEVGTPFKLCAMAYRLWCGNGAFYTICSQSTYTRTHRASLVREHGRIQSCYESIRMEFGAYAENAAKLQQTEMDKEQQRLFVAELLAPGFTQKVAAKLSEGKMDDNKVWQEVADTTRGRMILNEVIKTNAADFGRTGQTLIDAIVNQNGANGANLWSAYNGITWHVDHKRGRNAESGVDAAIFGAGAQLKVQALETALKFVQ